MRRDPQVVIAPPEGPAIPVSAPPPIGDALRGWHGLARLALVAAFAGALVSCKSVDDGGSRKPGPIVGARLAPAGGSAVTGAVRFEQLDGGVRLMANTMNAPPGRSRMVIHVTGNCSSFNAFSAGPPLTLPGSSEPVMVWITTPDADDSSGVVNVRLPGLTIDGPTGINGKSVVVHAGYSGSLEAQPGVRNDRIACGVIESIPPLF